MCSSGNVFNVFSGGAKFQIQTDCRVHTLKYMVYYLNTWDNWVYDNNIFQINGESYIIQHIISVIK